MMAAMSFFLRSRLQISALLFVALLPLGCGEDPKPEESKEPIVGLLELPIALRYENQIPDGAMRIETNAAKLRVNAQTILELDRGKIKEGDAIDNEITKLRAEIDMAKPPMVLLYLDGTTPWSTTLALLRTLEKAQVSRVAFAVRKGTSADLGYLTLGSFMTAPPEDQYLSFQGPAQRQWDEFHPHWADAEGACNGGDQVNCDPKPAQIQEGGMAHITLFARGNALKVEIDRFEKDGDGAPGAEAPEGEAAAEQAAPESKPSGKKSRKKKGGGKDTGTSIVDMLGLDEELPPAVHAAFSWRFEASTSLESPISAMMRPFCGAAPCGATVTAEGQTHTMRVLSFIAAAYPNGTPEPVLRFRLNLPGR